VRPLERVAPMLAANARQAKTIRDMQRLVEKQRGRIGVLLRERDEAWSLVLDLQLDLAELKAERDALMETTPTDLSDL
jgi:hypothetical protein